MLRAAAVRFHRRGSVDPWQELVFTEEPAYDKCADRQALYCFIVSVMLTEGTKGGCAGESLAKTGDEHRRGNSLPRSGRQSARSAF